MASHNPHDDPSLSDDLWETGPSYMASNKPLARLVARPVREFLRVEAGAVGRRGHRECGPSGGGRSSITADRLATGRPDFPAHL